MKAIFERGAISDKYRLIKPVGHFNHPEIPQFFAKETLD